MNGLLLWIGRVAGGIGVLALVVAFTARAANIWRLGGYQVGAVLQAALAFMLVGALAYVASIAERRRD
ncbi:MAG TPA: hypothetical protein VGI14_16855 [Casimicrobiaceae bacterium]|jgi:hypothetical protein